MKVNLESVAHSGCEVAVGSGVDVGGIGVAVGTTVAVEVGVANPIPLHPLNTNINRLIPKMNLDILTSF